MKNTARILNKHPEKHQSSQAQTTLTKPHKDAVITPGSRCLMLYDSSTDKTLAACEISRDEWEGLQNHAKVQNCQLLDVLREAIHEKLYVGCDMRAKAEELRQAVAQVNTLIEIYAGFDEVGTSEFQFGMAMLADTARKRLTSASDKVHQGICARSEVAA